MLLLLILILTKPAGAIIGVFFCTVGSHSVRWWSIETSSQYTTTTTTTTLMIIVLIHWIDFCSRSSIHRSSKSMMSSRRRLHIIERVSELLRRYTSFAPLLEMIDGDICRYAFIFWKGKTHIIVYWIVAVVDIVVIVIGGAGFTAGTTVEGEYFLPSRLFLWRLCSGLCSRSVDLGRSSLTKFYRLIECYLGGNGCSGAGVGLVFIHLYVWWI
mmetsp:Transcript_25192/g.38975  ORF Transcript_25192/g.38975 Transcript_25192/m.38975 type:complete len:213 (+) Transcript_25192:996-1634(+)